MFKGFPVIGFNWSGSNTLVIFTTPRFFVSLCESAAQAAMQLFSQNAESRGTQNGRAVCGKKKQNKNMIVTQHKFMITALEPFILAHNDSTCNLSRAAHESNLLLSKVG
jgi:hypothetical protein